jgi:hypothetical protein
VLSWFFRTFGRRSPAADIKKPAADRSAVGFF